MGRTLAWLRRWGASVASLGGGLLTLFVFRRGLPNVGWIVGYLMLVSLLFIVFIELRQRGHVIFVPGGRSRSSVSTASFPSVDAASTIPLDSIPMSFAGSRFATTTTFLPTSSAGA